MSDFKRYEKCPCGCGCEEENTSVLQCSECKKIFCSMDDGCDCEEKVQVIGYISDAEMPILEKCPNDCMRSHDLDNGSILRVSKCPACGDSWCSECDPRHVCKCHCATPEVIGFFLGAKVK